MSEKYQLVLQRYLLGLWKERQIRDAVAKGWITPEEYKAITGKDYGAA